MKKLVLLFTLTLTALPALADLGDNYATSCKRFGGRGTPRGEAVLWPYYGGVVAEVFYHNQCVSITYMAQRGRYFYEGEIWKRLQWNSLSNAHWTKYAVDKDGNPEYTNQDSSIYGLAVSDGSAVRIAYASYLLRKGLLDAPNSSASQRPPVEESDGPNI